MAVCAAAFVLCGCNMPGRSASIAPTRTPLPLAVATATASPGPAPTTEASWERIAPGIELQIAELPVNRNVGSAAITILRLEPDRIQLKTFYAPDSPVRVSQWHQRTGALATINGGFFTTADTVQGLLVSEGQRYGTTFDRHGGMLTVVQNKIEVRSLAQFPYDPAEPLDEAVQGRPMILYPGGFPTQFDDVSDVADRRTAVGMDRSGRLLFIVADHGIVSLYRLRDWLASERPDLDMFVAFNLDGGHSTGIVIDGASTPIAIDSRTDVPAVIAIYQRK
jgi:exopolysaccharide biosynthesis protein